MFLQDFAYPVFVFFQGAKHRELITGGVADAHGYRWPGIARRYGESSLFSASSAPLGKAVVWR